MKPYQPSDIEAKWQQTWNETDLYRALDDDARQKYYYLFEFPYPSGDGLHVGHLRPYVALDVMARHKRMEGYNVLFPIGWDAFGLPTENFAIKNKIAPQIATERNVATFKRQVQMMGVSVDWSREINTTDPSYYRWTQWIFLRLLEKGLAYQAEMPINWCPLEKTGLANEEVVNGVHERCGTPVEKKLLKQWMLRITAYADRLIDDLATVDYPDRIASQQINWIGRSEGIEISWQVCDEDGHDRETELVVFTTRKDTLPGVTFMVIAPESSLLHDLVTDEQRAAVDEYRLRTESISDLARQESKDKTGVFTGSYAKNPLTGTAVPIYVADYVLAGYGTGVVMGMGGHDERDRVFALKYDLPIVLTTAVPEGYEDVTSMKIWKGAGKQINTGEGYDGLSNVEAGEKIIAALVAKGQARPRTNYKLRDWIFSRQHYWGEPIPVVHCPQDGVVAVPEDQLPVKLPKVDYYEPTETGESPLAAITDWVDTICPTCGGPAKRETDTMPNWAGSSWYFLRYADPHNDQAFADRSKLDHWTPVDLYNGGMEHTTLHLLYSRFWHKFLFDEGLVPTTEPYLRRRSHGMILGPDGRKMSKSVGNVINPDHVVERYGADALRLYEMFMGPFEDTTSWSEERLNGVSKFAYRVWTLITELSNTSETGLDATDYVTDLGAFTTETDRMLHKTLKKVHEDIESMRFNTAVSALMELLNYLTKAATKARLQQDNARELRARTIRLFLLMLAPFIPHLTEELWHEVGETESIHRAAWPTYDPMLIEDDVKEVAIQVNGKLRATIIVAADATNDEMTAAAAAHERVAGYLESGEIIKTIVVPQKLINFVIKA